MQPSVIIKRCYMSHKDNNAVYKNKIYTNIDELKKDMAELELNTENLENWIDAHKNAVNGIELLHIDEEKAWVLDDDHQMFALYPVNYTSDDMCTIMIGKNQGYFSVHGTFSSLDQVYDRFISFDGYRCLDLNKEDLKKKLNKENYICIGDYGDIDVFLYQLKI